MSDHLSISFSKIDINSMSGQYLIRCNIVYSIGRCGTYYKQHSRQKKKNHLQFEKCFVITQTNIEKMLKNILKPYLEHYGKYYSKF